MLCSATASVMWTMPSASGGVVSAAISSEFNALRASPSEILARCAQRIFVRRIFKIAQPALGIRQRALQQVE